MTERFLRNLEIFGGIRYATECQLLYYGCHVRNPCVVQLSIFDWLEAFQAHPSIGERTSGEDSGSSFSSFSAVEQSVAAETADESVKQVVLQ